MKKTKIRADRRAAKLMQFLDQQLSNPDINVAAQAATDLKELLLAQGQLKDRAAERALRQDELAYRKGTAPGAAVSKEDTIAKLRAEIEQGN
jgi:hypothetical protein